MKNSHFLDNREIYDEFLTNEIAQFLPLQKFLFLQHFLDNREIYKDFFINEIAQALADDFLHCKKIYLDEA